MISLLQPAVVTRSFRLVFLHHQRPVAQPNASGPLGYPRAAFAFVRVRRSIPRTRRGLLDVSTVGRSAFQKALMNGSRCDTGAIPIDRAEAVHEALAARRTARGWPDQVEEIIMILWVPYEKRKDR